MFKKGKALSIFLAVALLIQCMSIAVWPLKASAASLAPFDYALFANGEIRFNGKNNSNFNSVTGSVHANGQFTANGGTTINGDCEAASYTLNGTNTITGQKTTAANIPMAQLPSDIQTRLQNTAIVNNNLNYDQDSIGSSINYSGSIVFNKALNITSSNIVIAGNSITFRSVDVNSNGNAVFIYAKNGDIIIDGHSHSTVNGTLYAPNGSVIFNGSNDYTINGSIVAKNITINGGKVIINKMAQPVSPPSLPNRTIKILEVQPGMAYDLDASYKSALEAFYNKNVEITNMPMSLFISKVDEINGLYDIVYIGNNTSDGAQYSFIGSKVSNKPNYSAGVTNDVEYYNGNDITNLASQKLVSFIESKQLVVFNESIFASSLENTKLYKNFIKYRNNNSYPNFKVSSAGTVEKTVKQPNYPANAQYFTGKYYNNGFLLDYLKDTRNDAAIDFDWGTGSPGGGVNSNNFYVVWTGQIKAEVTGSYTFNTTSDDGIRVYVRPNGNNDYTRIIDAWRDQGTTTYTGNFSMQRDTVYDIKVEYYESSGGAVAKLSWTVPASSGSGQLLSALKQYGSAGINLRPTLDVTSSPIQYTGDNAIANGGLMGYTMNLKNNNSSANMTVKLYLDQNGDGIYQDTEVVGQYNNVGSVNGYTVNYSLPANFSGLAPWKLEVTDSLGVKAYKTGHSAYKGAELNIRVLQLLPANSDGSATFKLSSLSSVNGQNMLVKAGEYNISVTEMKINDFNNNYGSKVSNKQTTLNGNYDMVVVGFDDSYAGDLDNSKGALDALTAFADSGQSIMFTHDTIGFNSASSSGGNKMVNVTKAFKDRLGLNAFATDETMPEAGKNSTGMTRLSLDNANGKLGYFPDTVKTKKINESNITRYPYVLGDITVSPTHLQYLRLDAEDPEINVAYTYKNEYRYNHGTRTATLYSPLTPETAYNENDGFNDYYTYSKGSLTFSGTGHSPINSVDEMKMFINTIYKASIGANHAPALQINGLTANQNIPPSQETVRFSFIATDVDWIDKNYDANIYIDRNNNGAADNGELVTFNTGDTATFKNVTNGVVQNVEITRAQLGLADSVQQFGIIVTATDKRGAKATQVIQLSHKSQPTLSVLSDAAGSLIGDTAAINFRFNPVATGVSNVFKNIRLTVNLSALTNDVKVASLTGWTQSANSYSTTLPDLTFNASASWASDATRNLQLTALRNSQRLTQSYVLDIPVSITYDRYDEVTKKTISETAPATVQMGIADGILDVYANDNTVKGINNAPVTLTGPMTASGTTQSGAVRFSGLKAGTYTVSLTIPEGYVNAGTTLTKSISISYNSYSGGSMPSVTFGVTQKVPEAPTNLAAEPGDKLIKLTWSAPSGADSNYRYIIKRSSVPGGPYTEIAADIGTTSYTNTGLTNGTRYYYVVYAINKAINAKGPDSNEANAKPLAKPSKPTGLTALAGDGVVTVSWAAVNGAVGYKLCKGTTSGYYTEFITVENGTSYTDNKVQNGTKYYYAVIALNENGIESDKSDEVSAVPKPALAAPTGINASYINGKVVLGWDTVDTAESYIIRRGTSPGGPYSDIGSSTSARFIDSGISQGNTYYYVVCAVKGEVQSTNSQEVSISILAGKGEALLPYGVLKFGVDTGISADDGTSSSNITFIPGQYVPFSFELGVSSSGEIKNSQLVIKKNLLAAINGENKTRDFILEMRKVGGSIDKSKVTVTKNGTALPSQNYEVVNDINGNIVINLVNGITLTQNDTMKIKCIAKVSSSGDALNMGVKKYIETNGINYMAAFQLNSTANNTNIPAGDYLIDIRVKNNSIIQ